MSILHLSGRSRFLSISVPLWLLLGATTRAATWHVTYDPDHPEDRVGAVAAQAVSGDLILIDPGTYYEHIPLEGKSLTFVGTGGASATILDGGRSLPDREGSIIYTLTGAAADLELQGLTLQHGSGAPVVWDSFHSIGGGALLWLNVGYSLHGSHSGSLAVTDCVFEDNTTGGAGNLWAVGGGAIYAEGLVGVQVARCSFSSNVAHTRGNDLFFNSNLDASVTQCDFNVTQGGSDGGNNGGASIHCEAEGALTIQGCLFQAERAGAETSESIWADARTLHLLDNTFADHGGSLATRLQLDCLCAGPVQSEILISGNVFWNRAGADSAAPTTVYAWIPGESVTIRENTFGRCGVEVSDPEGGGSPMVFENNIIARGTVFFSAPQGGDYSCNDFWRTPVLGGGNLTSSNNITADPLFCDEANGGLTLSEGSPCAPPTNLECGLVGAEPVTCDLEIHACCVGQGCQLTTEQECSDLGGRWMINPPHTSCDPNPCIVPVVKTTWGGIKAMFRSATR